MMKQSRNKEAELPDLNTSAWQEHEKGVSDDRPCQPQSRHARLSNVASGLGYAVAFSAAFFAGYGMKQQSPPLEGTPTPQIAAGDDLPPLPRFGSLCPDCTPFAEDEAAKIETMPEPAKEGPDPAPASIANSAPVEAKAALPFSAAQPEDMKVREGYLESCSKLQEELKKECESYPSSARYTAELVVCQGSLARIEETLNEAKTKDDGREKVSTESLKATEDTLHRLLYKLRCALVQEHEIRKIGWADPICAWEINEEMLKKLDKVDLAKLLFEAKRSYAYCQGIDNFHLGLIYYQNGMPEEATIAISRAISEKPFREDAYCNLAWDLFASEPTPEAALKRFWEIVQENGDSTIARFGLACYFDASGNRGDALKTLNEAVAAMPKPDPKISIFDYSSACKRMLEKLKALEVSESGTKDSQGK